MQPSQLRAARDPAPAHRARLAAFARRSEADTHATAAQGAVIGFLLALFLNTPSAIGKAGGADLGQRRNGPRSPIQHRADTRT
jgi:hypothetical protein